MRKLLLFTLLIFNSYLFAQTYNDGCMDVRIVATRAWNEEYEDPFANDESNWQWWFADLGDVDGMGWRGGNCLAQGGAYQIGWWNHTDVTILNTSYGVAGANSYDVPQFFRLRGHYEGDDCGGSCDYCTSNPFDNDDYRYDEVVGTLNYRFAGPNTNNYFQAFTNWHGSSDYGGEFYVRYTSPRPNVTASTTQICQGTSTNVTLSFTGAIFGGSYVVYDGATIVYNGIASSTTLSVNATKTYRVYTRNGGVNSNCYSTVQIIATNCDFNCVTSTSTAWNASYDASSGTSSSVSFTSPGNFPTNSYISDVNVSISFLKTDGTCAAPASGSAFHGETVFRVNNSTLGNVSLVDRNFIGNTALSAPITITFDEDATNSVVGHNVTNASNGQSLDPVGNLNNYDWGLISSTSNWSIFGGDAISGDPLCTYGYQLNVCGCKTANYGIATVNGSSSTISICGGGSGTITLSHNGSSNGSMSNNGYGDELRWFSGSCGGTYVGSGMNLTIPSPTVATTYYASFYVDGQPCRGVNSYCESISVNITPATVAGTITPATQTICQSLPPTNLILSGHTGSVLGWQYSSDGATWVTASGTSTNPNFSPVAYANIVGTHYFRAAVQNGGCNTEFTVPVEMIVKPNPSSGAISSLVTEVCTGESYSLNANGYTGDIQWQVSTINSTTGFNNISGATSPSIGETITNAGPGVISRWYRIAVTNAPCVPIVYSNVIQIDINPSTIAGTVDGPNDSVCINGNPGVLTLTGYVGSVTSWQRSINGAAYTNIINTNDTYSPGVLSTVGTYDFRAIVKSGTCSPDTTLPFRIYVIPATTASISGADSVCSGNSVTLTATASGGTGTYTYQWQRNGVNVGTNSSTLNTDAALTAGNYSYTVIVGSGPCAVTSAAHQLTVLPNPQITNVSSTNLTCYNVNIGTINITANSDSFSIDSGLTYVGNNSFTGLPAGTYYVVVKNATGCFKFFNGNPVIITQPDSITISFNIVEPSCATSNNGQITVNAVGGTPGYEYSINGGSYQSGNTFNNLSDGIYTIRVRDNNNCVYSKDTTLTAQYTFALTTDSIKDISCTGSTDGYVELSPVGGVAPFQFSQDNSTFVLDSVFTNLSAGNYTFYAEDDNGCTANTSVSLVEQPPIQIELDSVHQIMCNGDATGAIYVTASGSTPNYTYEWRLNGTVISTNDDITGLSGGTYNLTVSTSSSCVENLDVTLLEPTALSITATNVTDASCNGATDGSVQVSVTGGTPSYTYAWVDGTSNLVSATQNLSNVGADSYTLTVTDANGCTATTTAPVVEPAALSVSTVTNDPSCSNSNDGSITVNVTGGTAGYMYSLNNGAPQGSNVFNNLSAGSYTIEVEDANGCTATGNAILTDQYTFSIAIDSQFNVSCSGNNDGYVRIANTGGTLPISYTINGTNAQTSNEFTGLGAGLYTFEATDDNGCSATVSTTITENPPMTLSLDSTKDVSCNGQNTGEIHVHATGGATPYSYSVNGGAGQATGSFTGLAAGSYNVVVTDVNGCAQSLSATITQPTPLTATVTNVTDVSCNGATDGSVQVSVTGGTPSYTYAWVDGTSNPVSATQNLSNVGADSYTLTVTDANGCTATTTATVVEPVALSVSTVTNDPSCSNSNDGSITVNVTGGTAGYMYSLNNGAPQGSNVFNNLSAGSYTIEVEDANGCTATGNAILTDQYTLSLSVANQTNVSCSGQNDGTVTLQATGGNGTITYTINGANPQTSNIFTGLAAGLYTFEATDANGCSATVSTTISENPPLVIAIDSVINETCGGNNSGAIYVTVTGGDGNYTYNWSNSTSQEDLTNVGGGTYTLIVTDGAGCSATITQSISSPASLSLVVADYSDITCNGANDGSVDISVAGGTPPYNFSWNTTATTEDIEDLSAGTYTIVVTDQNGCTATISQTIAEPVALAGSITTTDVACFGDNSGTASVTVSGGTAPYTYLWNTFETTSSISGLNAGIVSVIVTDKNGCQITLTDTVHGPLSALNINLIRLTHVTCFGGSNGEIITSVSGGTPPYTISWTPGGMTTPTVSNLSAGVYVMTVTDANGCVETASYTINQPSEIITTVSVTNPGCAGDETGMALIGASGGTLPYTYTWNTTPQQTGALANNLAGDTSYIVEITDRNGCTVYDTAVLVNPIAMEVSTTTQGVTCESNSNGEVAVIVTNGNPPFTYQLNGFMQTDSVFENLTEGTYVVNVIDQNDCSASAQFDIVTLATMEIDLQGAGLDNIFVSDELYIVRGEDVSLLVDVLNPGVGISSIHWSPNSGPNAVDTSNCGTQPCYEANVQPVDYVTVIVTAIDTNGCEAFDTLKINVSQEPLVFMPTAFSPNGDCVNDNFEINILGASNLDVRIFNRWGEEMFYNANQTNGLNNPNDIYDECMTGNTNPRGAWDGTFNSKPAPNGVYAYQIEATLFDGSKKTISGTVTLIR
ncbi:MAG: gliding motility-associated C-terminal domain-containing protein [Chitinophagales bacterium]|nr:gliding motility-associated C-terminal domain-containing protein [Chitinophagales bacterium]